MYPWALYTTCTDSIYWIKILRRNDRYSSFLFDVYLYSPCHSNQQRVVTNSSIVVQETTRTRKKLQISWHLFVFILWCLYVSLLHLMGSFGTFDCRMNNGQRWWILVIMILLIILLDWFDNQGRGVVIRRLTFDLCITDNQGRGWIIFDNHEGGWVVRRLLFDFYINNDQGEG